MDITFEKDEFTFNAAEQCDVRIPVTASEKLSPGDTVEFQFPQSWSLVSGPSETRPYQCGDTNLAHFVAVEANGAVFDMEIRERHLTYHDGVARHGRHIIATLKEGKVEARTPIFIVYANTFAPYVAEEETLWLHVKGEAPAAELALKVAPLEACDMRVIAPSVVRPGVPFDVLIVSLDKFQNCSRTSYENLALQIVGGNAVVEGLKFTGSTRVSVTLREEGVFRFAVGETISNAMCVSSTMRKLHWGDIHIHTKLSHDGQGSDPYGYARNVSGLNFAAACDHWESLGEEGERILLDWARAAHVPGQFVPILADERNPNEFTGHHNLYFRNETAFSKYRCAALRKTNPVRPPFDASVVKKDSPEVMIVPHHTGIAWGGFVEGQKTCAVDLDAADDCGLRPIMEIYSHHGQSETYAPEHVLAYEFNRMRRPERRANASTPGPYYAQEYWKAGRRLGVIGSSDDHAGQTGIRHGGIAAVWSDELTCDGLFSALFERRCYATTGERILVDFCIDDLKMGAAGTRKPADKVNIRLSVWGTDLLLRVEILRYRFGHDQRFVPIVSAVPRPESTDMVLEMEHEIVGPCVYYARVTQGPLEWPDMAWTSPIWIDVSQAADIG